MLPIMNPWDGGVLLLSIKQREKKLRIFHHSRTVISKPHFVSLIKMHSFSSGFSVFFSGSSRNSVFMFKIAKSWVGVGVGVVFCGHVKLWIFFFFFLFFCYLIKKIICEDLVCIRSRWWWICLSNARYLILFPQLSI